MVAPYACQAQTSRGRLFPETECTMRSPFQRDRDRIIHCSAFRRLTYKTQVFIYHEGDHYRNRLTHSLEVAQIARTLSRLLEVDEDLGEAQALAHDLGHTPFGHAGERALNSAMAPYGGFDHNAQSLLIVTELERKYAKHDGLNLSWEMLEGLVKHNGPLIEPLIGAELKTVDGERETALPSAIRAYNKKQDLLLDHYAGLEAQIAALADDIAYNNHDIDDGLRAGMISFEELEEVPLMQKIIAEVDALYPGLKAGRRIYEVNRRLITAMVDNVLHETKRNLAALAPKHPDDIRRAGQVTARFSESFVAELDELRFFLFSRVYRNPRVNKVMTAAANIVTDLFQLYMKAPDQLPEQWRARVEEKATEQDYAALICHFVAGMTDRFAIQDHQRLFDVTPELR